MRWSFGILRRALAGLILLLAPLHRAVAAFPLVRAGHAASLVVSPGDFKVVSLAAADLAEDIGRVTGTTPAIAAVLPGGSSAPAVVIGTLGHSAALDALVAAGRLDVSALRGRWETFLLATLRPVDAPGSPPLFVIAGSDRRGTAFGVYELSQQIGVSPWWWWADVTPRHQDSLLLPDGLRRFGPPSVKYRGLFLNDEDWGLQPWAARTFEPKARGLGPKTYAEVFALLLRLKANTLWPAMHACTPAFNSDPRNAALADDYAIVMGSSHAEPMLRNNVSEWTASPAAYNYVANRSGVSAYWAARLRTNGRYENLYTLGMRGIHDSALQGASTDAQRIAVLGQVFTDQRHLLRAYVNDDLTAVPQVFCAYKEVLDLYRQGLAVPADVTIIWPDDNFGYVRHFASATERSRPGGFGVYYHLSYLGRPLSYLWLGTTPPALVWEEMTKAYAFGADRIWIANVGDLKPTEPGVEFFLRLAWDIHQWGPDAQPEFLRAWAARDFGAAQAGEIAAVMGGFYQLNFQRKPEHLQWWLPGQPPRRSPCTLAAADARLAAFAALRQRVDRLASILPADRQDAFEELVGYPVRASALANQRYFLGERGDERNARSADAALHAITQRFNDEIAGGKWRGVLQLEPADAQWKSMRLAPWTPPEFARSTDLPSGPGRILAARAAGTFDTLSDRAGSGWRRVAGLGRSGHAITLAPVPSPLASSAIDLGQSPTVDYTVELPAGAAWIHLELLPTHSVDAQAGSRLALACDNLPPQLLRLPADDGSAAWAQGVLTGTRTLSLSVELKTAGPHRLRLYALDPGVAVDRLVVTSAADTPFLCHALNQPN